MPVMLILPLLSATTAQSQDIKVVEEQPKPDVALARFEPMKSKWEGIEIGIVRGSDSTRTGNTVVIEKVYQKI